MNCDNSTSPNIQSKRKRNPVYSSPEESRAKLQRMKLNHMEGPGCDLKFVPTLDTIPELEEPMTPIRNRTCPVAVPRAPTKRKLTRKVGPPSKKVLNLEFPTPFLPNMAWICKPPKRQSMLKLVDASIASMPKKRLYGVYDMPSEILDGIFRNLLDDFALISVHRTCKLFKMVVDKIKKSEDLDRMLQRRLCIYTPSFDIRREGIVRRRTVV